MLSCVVNWRHTSIQLARLGGLALSLEGGPPHRVAPREIRATKSCSIHTSGHPFFQFLYLPHFQKPLASVANKRLTTVKACPQTLWNQHLRPHPGCVATTGLITPSFTTLAALPALKPFVCHTSKKQGGAEFNLGRVIDAGKGIQ